MIVLTKVIKPMVGGSLVSEPGYDIQIDGSWHGSGNDYMYVTTYPTVY